MSFPSVYIEDYKGVPVPVVDRNSGELVSIITRPEDFGGGNPNPPITVIPDNNPVGLTSDDPRFDIILGGVYVQNTGFSYSDAVRITVTDKDQEKTNGELSAIVREGRIVAVEIINSGTSFRRLPKLTIFDNSGYGAIIFPVMSLVPREGGENPQFKPEEAPIEAIFCQSRDLKNLY